jgi:endonuclease/exonuclease/phosphatase family metal-dependent hydrolase
VHCYVVHLGLFAGSRMRQAAALIEAVRSSAPPDAPVIIAGDFNDWGNRLGGLLRARLDVTEVFDQRKSFSRSVFSTLRKLTGRAPKLAAARTFPAALPMLSLDRIYLRGLKVESAEVLHGALWAKLSDHSPIIATLQLD